VVPKYDKNRAKRVVLNCREPGCGKEFWGRPIAKYCDHRDIRFRKRRKRVYDTELNNRYKHRYGTTVRVIFNCRACGADYPLTIYPKQQVYPAYCPHVNPFRRKRFESR